MRGRRFGQLGGATLAIALHCAGCDAGGAPRVVAANQDSPHAIAVDSVNVYWTTSGENVMTASVNGGSIATLATSQGSAGDLVVDDTYVYWLRQGLQRQVMRVPITGGVASAISPDGFNDLVGVQLAVDCAHVYSAVYTPGMSDVMNLAALNVPPHGGVVAFSRNDGHQ